MNIYVPGMRDRRTAAADETHAPSAGGGPRPIYGRGTSARRMSESRRAFDVRRATFNRAPTDINTVILHQITAFHPAPLPGEATDGDIHSDHSLDHVIAHFVVRATGEIIYTHDVQFILNSVSGRHGVDIEFEGGYGNQTTPQGTRLSRQAILSGQRLLRWLDAYLPNLRYIHPHGQIQGRGRGKHDSCPGPDVWVNVGQWAVANLGLVSDRPHHSYPNHGISPAQTNPNYDQHVS